MATYTYILDTLGNKELGYDELESNILYILCYHINNQSKYPFLQFMLEKIPFCHNLVEEKLVIPNVCVSKNTSSIQKLILEKIKNAFTSIGLAPDAITEQMYNGILFSEQFKTNYALVNITGLNIDAIALTRNSSYWFVLPTEIINTKEVCGISVDQPVVKLFIHNPQLALLTNCKTDKPYILPDAVYTLGQRKAVEFSAIFGNIKTKVYKSCSSYYYFYRSFIDAINQINDFSEKGINRYALFIEGELYYETNKSFSLTDSEIEARYPEQEQTIVICYRHHHNVAPDLLVRKDTIFIPLSSHFFQL
jgi:hypothetical protein